MRQDYPEAALDAAVRDACSSQDGIVVHWVVVAAVRGDKDGIEHSYFTADGQPKYATVGLLTMTTDWLRGIGQDES